MDGTIVYVMLNDCLVTIKSGNPYPLNIGDFMPDYNLWYGLKYMSPGAIAVLDTPIISRDYPGTSYMDIKIRFISKWLSQVACVSEVYISYSLDGSWRSNLFPESHDIIDSVGIRRKSRFTEKLFIDNPWRTGEEYVKLQHPEFLYMDKTEFIREYNKNPRIYEKDQSKKTVSSGLAGEHQLWIPRRPDYIDTGKS